MTITISELINSYYGEMGTNIIASLKTWELLQNRMNEESVKREKRRIVDSISVLARAFELTGNKIMRDNLKEIIRSVEDL